MKQARANSLSHLVWWALVAPSLGIAALIALLLVADPETTSFDRLDLGWLAALGPAAGLMMYYGGVRRRRSRAAFSSAKLAPLLTVRLSLARRAFRGGLVAVALHDEHSQHQYRSLQLFYNGEALEFRNDANTHHPRRTALSVFQSPF